MASALSSTAFMEFGFESPTRARPIAIDGDLSDWDEANLVPDLMHLRGSKPFAEVYFTWDGDSLYVAYRVTGKKKPLDVDPRRFWRRDTMELWIDLRNDKPVRRYNEHCHHFFLLGKGRQGDNQLATAGACDEPGNALSETIYDHPGIECASVIESRSYTVETRISRDAIPTYDPSQYPVIGFNYHINDTDRRAQWWNCGLDFSRHTDPSTWGQIELIR